MPPLNRKASVVVPWASLILAAGFVDMLSVCSERKARGCGACQQSRSASSMPATHVRHTRHLHARNASPRVKVAVSALGLLPLLCSGKLGDEGVHDGWC